MNTPDNQRDQSQKTIFSNPDMCSRCDASGNSCCKLRGGMEEGMPTPVSRDDIDRIARDMPQVKNQHFFDYKQNAPLFIEQMAGLFPDRPEAVYSAFPETGRHYELSTVVDRCFFLSNEGCLLSAEARPLFCRIYPFWFFGDSPQLFQDDSCLALQSCKTVQEVYLALGTNPEQLKNLHDQLCLEWELLPSIQHLQTSYLS